MAVAKKVGFVPYTTRDIWQGHPAKVLGVTQSWVDKNPTTSRALIAGLLSACQFCEQEQNQTEVAEILAKSQYINVPSSLIESALGENYHYEQLEQPLSDGTKIADLSLFHGQKGNYLQKLDHINYPWRSHGVWLLTQLVRWQQLGLSAYPRNADSLLDRVYPLGIYEEVAKGLKIELPSDRLKIEPKTTFIDQREFDPSQPVAYLNQFAIRNS
jgi:nitrate/nitrite transport system substrate-binding protein